MAERASLEERLAGLGRHVEWPPTPDLRAGVRTRLRERPRRRRRRLGLLLLAAALALTLGAGAAAAGYLGLRGASVQRVEHLPSPAPQPPGPLGTRLDLGQRYTSVAAAGAAAGFQPLVPSELGSPDEVYARTDPQVVSLVWHPRPGLPASSDPQVGALLMEAPGATERYSFGKLAGPGTAVTAVSVNGGAGYWVSGAPHGFFLYRSGPATQADRFRLADDVLVWNQEGRVLRLESGLDERAALRVAGTARRRAV